MKRRALITLLGGAGAWPLAARAQQQATPVIGFVDARSPDAMADRLRGFRRGLAETGYVEGDNVIILYRWGENKVDRLPELAAELVGRRVTVTGINFYNSELVAKQLELLRELVPQAIAVAVFVNPANANTCEATSRDIEPAARAMGLEIKLLRASTSREIDAAFVSLGREQPNALFIGNDAFFNSRRVQFVQLAAHHRLPAIYSGREY